MKKEIRFITPNYVELFRIPDGGEIRITYPPGDGRGTVTAQCKYHDEMHFDIVGGTVYHICQFAEIMERVGAKVEPAYQLHGAELVSIAPGEDKCCTFCRMKGNTRIGHIYGDFGHDGSLYFQNWTDSKKGRDTDDFQKELLAVMFRLRQDALKNFDAMKAYCWANPDAKLDNNGLDIYGFKIETESRRYMLRCNFEGKGTFILYAYDKCILIGGVVPHAEDEENLLYRNSDNPFAIGYMRGDFGRSGDEFWHNWFHINESLYNAEFKDEFQIVVDLLRNDVLKNKAASISFCHEHPDARLKKSGGRYGFKTATEKRRYFVSVPDHGGDYFYVYVYDKDIKEN